MTTDVLEAYLCLRTSAGTMIDKTSGKKRQALQAPRYLSYKAIMSAKTVDDQWSK